MKKYYIVGTNFEGTEFLINEDLTTEENLIENIEHYGNLFDTIEQAQDVVAKYMIKNFDDEYDNTYHIGEWEA